MGHKHSVYDSDAHFSINPITKVIKNESSKKTTLVQGDHNSERFSFDIPRHIEGHDMMQCNLVEVHYDNKETGTNNISSDFYEVKDMQISPDDEEMVVFSWLIIDTATKYAGSLEFSIIFKCMTGDVCDYKWGTTLNTDISVSKGKDNSGVVVERAPNVVDQWRSEIFGDAENAVANINLAEQNALEAVQAEGANQLEQIQVAGENIVNAATIAEQNAKNVLANAIKGHLKGEVVVADDVSPVEHEMVVKARSKNHFIMSKIGTTSKFTKNEDGSITVSAGQYSCPTGIQLKTLCPSLKVGETAVLSIDSAGLDFIYSNAVIRHGVPFVVTEKILEGYVAIYGAEETGNDFETEHTIRHIQIESGETITEPTPYIDPATVTVRRCGKNLFDVSNYKTLNGNLDVNEQNGYSHIVQGAVGSSTNSYSSGAFTIKLPSVIPIKEVLTVSLYVTLQEQGAWSNAFRLWCVDRAEDFADYRTFELEVGKRTKITASFTVENADSLARLTFYVNNNKLLIELDTLQIEKSNYAEEYESYKGTDHTPSSDGTVSGMTSLSPNMTILTDTEGVVVECEYNKDTNKVIQKLADALGVTI